MPGLVVGMQSASDRKWQDMKKDYGIIMHGVVNEAVSLYSIASDMAR